MTELDIFNNEPIQLTSYKGTIGAASMKLVRICGPLELVEKHFAAKRTCLSISVRTDDATTQITLTHVQAEILRDILTKQIVDWRPG